MMLHFFFFFFRDHWNKCIDYINGGQTSWQEVSSGLSCQCLLEILQEMINENSGCITITNSIAIEHTVLPGLVSNKTCSPRK